MGEKMSLQQVRDAMLEEKAWARGTGWPMAAGTLQRWADAIDAHLTQPAQAVDVGQGRFALNDRVRFNNGTHVFGGYVHRIEYPHTIYYVQLDDGCEYACYGDDPKVTLTAALPNANGKEWV